MYKKSHYKQNGNSSDKELIDISSDDDASKVASKTGKETKMLEPVYNATKESSHMSSLPIVKSEAPIKKSETPVNSKTVYQNKICN